MAPGLCYGSRGGAAVDFHHQVCAYDATTLIGALGELRQFLGGQKATLGWDGQPAHRSKLIHTPGCGGSGPGWWWSRCLPTRPS
jgi:hypothetical protein